MRFHPIHYYSDFQIKETPFLLHELEAMKSVQEKIILVPSFPIFCNICIPVYHQICPLFSTKITVLHNNYTTELVIKFIIRLHIHVYLFSKSKSRLRSPCKWTDLALHNDIFADKKKKNKIKHMNK